MSVPHPPQTNWYPACAMADYSRQPLWRWWFGGFAVLHVVMVVGSFVNLHFPPWPTALAVLGIEAAVLLPKLRRIVWAWRVEPDGLWECHLLAPDRCHRWQTIRRVSETATSYVIETDAGDLEQRKAAGGAASFARVVRAALGQAPPRRETVPESQLAAWLGLAAGEELEAGAPWWSVALLGLAVLFFALLPLLAGVKPWLPRLALVGLAALLAVMLPTVAAPVKVSVAGVRWGRGWFAAWDEVTGIGATSATTWALQTEQGTVNISGPHRQRIREAVTEMLAAKDRGELLPRQAAVPDGALSRAESGDGAAERGLSRTEGEA